MKAKTNSEVTTAAEFCKHSRLFESDAEALGAFKLAHQQGLDGMGASIQEWMGVTNEQFATWDRRSLPVKRKKWDVAETSTENAP